jgi:hypothetical protein
MLLPNRTSGWNTSLELREHYYRYDPSTHAATVEWYVNFAHEQLFVAYGGPLFAQDEMQVAEHPTLACVREALLAEGLEPLTREGDEPTPILVTGAERRCMIAIEPNPEVGAPRGLYGNHFARAETTTIRACTRPVLPPTRTNLIAMEAPVGEGRYNREEILHILATAFTGFAAAKVESAHAGGHRCETVIHSGYWGCGAYGGNRVLMTTLQLLAAQLASVDRLVFHTAGGHDTDDWEEAKRHFDRLPGCARGQGEVIEVIEQIEGLGFTWGESDGN